MCYRASVTHLIDADALHQPTYLVRFDRRTGDIFMLAGEGIEINLLDLLANQPHNLKLIGWVEQIRIISARIATNRE